MLAERAWRHRAARAHRLGAGNLTQYRGPLRAIDIVQRLVACCKRRRASDFTIADGVLTALDTIA